MAKGNNGRHKEVILVFCAHSDDQVFGAGGTMAKYAKEGKEIHTVIFSFGESSHPWLREEITVEMRMKESEEANKIIGGKDVKFLGLKEGKFAEEFKEKNMFGVIHQLIPEMEPDKIFTHSSNDPHPDHKAVNKIVLEVVKNLKCKCDVFVFDVWTPLKLRKRSAPRLYVDITDTFQAKLEALEQFRSQWVAITLLKWSVYTKAFMDGIHNDSKYAESFVKEN
jgi:LmbE family N-acetylglucosaminyl deacetylase